MTPPLCTAPGCTHQVKPTRGKAPRTKGPRIIDGENWCWYCSRACAGRMQGLRSAAEGRMRRLAPTLAAAKAKAAKQRIWSELSDDVQQLARQFGVPAEIASGMLMRAYRRGEQLGYNRAYFRLARKAAA